MDLFSKHTSSARAAAWEAAGLRWLADAGTIPVVGVVAVQGPTLRLENVTIRSAKPDSAEAFGFQLARLHDAGATAFGAPPEGWAGDGYLGPSDDLLPLPLRQHGAWGRHYADDCVGPTAELAIARGGLGADARPLVDRVRTRLHDGDFDDDQPPARIHGDLWSGNVMWTAHSATLIDPAAHGGHRETDLATLMLFGCAYWEIVLAGYETAHPLVPGWQERVALHQLHHLLVHCACFGAGYAERTYRALKRYA